MDRLLGEWGIPKDSPAGRERFSQGLEERRRQERKETDWTGVERGWCLGDAAFKAELLSQMRLSPKNHHGEELRQADEAHAEKLLRAELQRRGWSESELAHRRKGDPQKVAIAWRLRCESAMTLKWIAARLHMGVWTSVSNRLSQKRQQEEQCQ